MTTRHCTPGLIAILAAVLCAFPVSASAQLREMRQVIFGMD